MRLFGKSKNVQKKKEVRPEDSIEKLRETLDMLQKREQYLERNIAKEIDFARKNASTNKRAALMALKRKKGYEAQIEKLTATQMTIEEQLMVIEGAQVNLETMKALRTGAKAMEKIHGAMTIDQVDDTMDEIREQMDLASEISDAISQPLGNDLLDDMDLEAELDELQSQSIDEQLLGARAPSSHVPTPIQEPAPVQESNEEEELRMLEASMAFN